MGRIMKRSLAFAVISLLIIILAACGSKSEEKVVKKIDEKLSEINGYKIAAEMKMMTGKEERNYDVDVWYKKGETEFYRVGLDNDAEEGGQVILKNKEGVFVLTPALNKSFKFRTEWPENSSQPYLYQSIVKDILADKDASFSAEDNAYVFLTKTNYQNNTNLPFQKVYFDKKTFTPMAVEVMDKDKQVQIKVSFKDMQLDPVFEKQDFQRNSILKKKEEEETSVAEVENQEVLSVMFPLETLGAELSEKKEVNTEDGERVIMTFKGDKNFTLIQERDVTVPTFNSVKEINGEMVNLGFSVGALSNQTIEWNYEGTDFVLASEDMTMEELITVASSVKGQEIK